MPINLETGKAAGPINANDSQSQAQVKIFSPKFFDTALTGNGTNRKGRLSENANPAVFPTGIPMTIEHTHVRKTKMTSGLTTTTMIPLNPIPYDAWTDMKYINRPPIVLLHQFGLDSPTLKNQLYIEMKPHSIIIEETDNSTQGGSKSTRMIPCYQVLIYYVINPNDNLHNKVAHVRDLRQSCDNCYLYIFTTDPVTKIEEIARQLAADKFTVDFKALNDFIQNYSLFEHVSKRSEEWQTSLDTLLQEYFANVTNRVGMLYGQTPFTPPKQLSPTTLKKAINVVRHIDQYNAPLELYRNIYQGLSKCFKPDDASTLCRQNLNLLLSDTMNSLNNNKQALNAVRTPNPVPPKSKTKFAYSTEQSRAISSQEPLVLVQSGAGTGKSTVILGRIDWMIANGVKPEEIMVLSFTNAAADHIKDLNPSVKSMTIARMIHTIYSTNFPDHLLSEIDTLANSLDIYFANDQDAMKFRDLCMAVKYSEPNSHVDLSTFIEENYDKVINFLNVTRQTSLELEIIICYQKIDVMTEPPEIQAKHLIIDEVQDNSVFEFIYALKYVEKHRESLFIVGDCSQTLYEFRASNPRAMNILEASGIFATHQLQVNYRSNQEILDFANVILQNIEANQYAQIQLIANSMAVVTEQSFREKVHLNYCRVSKLAEIPDCIQPILASPELKGYMDACIARGERIAFLAHKKKHVWDMENAIHVIYPGAATINMIPALKEPTTVLSRFIQTCWSNIQFVPTKHILQIIVAEMQNNLPKLSRSKNINTQSPSYQKFAAYASKTIDDWRRECAHDVNDWEIQYRAGQITLDELLDKIKESMLEHEIKNNKVQQSLKSGLNKKLKEANAKSNASFVFSTIHSAKGLEFDNVIMLYTDSSNMEEADKRMYYVAMTRAMHTEYILAFNTLKNTRIKNDYDTIIAQLHQTYPMPVPTTPATPTGSVPVSTGPVAATPVASVNPVPAAVNPAPANPVPNAVSPVPTSPVPATVSPAPVNPVPATVSPAPVNPVPDTVSPVPVNPVPAAVSPIPANPVPALVSPVPTEQAMPGVIDNAAAMPPAASIQDTFKRPATQNAVNPDTPSAMSLASAFANIAPGPIIEVQAPAGLDDIILPPGLKFINSDGKPCVIKPNTQQESDAPGEQN